ncbi:MAG: hypothetical protein ACK6DC_04960 [Planctomycetota bacterium]
MICNFRFTSRFTMRSLCLVFLSLFSGISVAQVAVDPLLPSYKPVAGVSGQLKSVGSYTMNPMILLWT